MSKINFWKGLSMISGVVNDLNEAYNDDQKITAPEIVQVSLNLVKEADLPFEENAERFLNVAMDVSKWVEKSKQDGVITIKELIELGETVAERFNYQFDKTGFTLK